MNYHKIEKTSVANGTGIRVVLWVSGCSLHCRGCHNPETWDVNSGKLFDEEAKKELFEALDKPYIQGITFSGGHPFEKENQEDIYMLCKEIKDEYPTKDIWLYTGYTYEFILGKKMLDIIALCDVIVDGRYIEEQRDITLRFRGSKNQRLIDVKETLKQNKVVTIQN